jgi:hypothetical protein
MLGCLRLGRYNLHRIPPLSIFDAKKQVDPASRMSFNKGRKMTVRPKPLWDIGMFSLKVYPFLSKTVGNRFWLKKP